MVLVEERIGVLKPVLNVVQRNTWLGTVLREWISPATKSRKELLRTTILAKIHSATISGLMIASGATEHTTQPSLALVVARSGEQNPKLSIALLTVWSLLLLLPRRKETWSLRVRIV